MPRDISCSYATIKWARRFRAAHELHDAARRTVHYADVLSAFVANIVPDSRGGGFAQGVRPEQGHSIIAGAVCKHACVGGVSSRVIRPV